MSDISPINTSAPRQAGRISADSLVAPRIADASADPIRGRGGARTDDRVEFSRVAHYLSQLQAEPTSSSDLVGRVRSQIKAGTYLTEDKLSVAIDELLDDISL